MLLTLGGRDPNVTPPPSVSNTDNVTMLQIIDSKK